MTMARPVAVLAKGGTFLATCLALIHLRCGRFGVEREAIIQLACGRLSSTSMLPRPFTTSCHPEAIRQGSLKDLNDNAATTYAVPSGCQQSTIRAYFSSNSRTQMFRYLTG